MNENTQKVMMDLARINGANRDGCPACRKPFNLGDTAVLACGLWEGGPRYIHEHEAVWDGSTGSYVERVCWNTSRQTR